MVVNQVMGQSELEKMQIDNADYCRKNVGRGTEPLSVTEKDLEKGRKDDASKEPLALLSRTWLLGVASVLAFGARKYAPHNWRRGIERTRLVSAALRHLFAYNEGEDNDPETGLSHLDHASCCLMFAREMHETHKHLDDRFKRGGKP